MATAIEALDCLDTEFGAKMRAAGCNSVGQLLAAGATSEGRRRLVAATGLSAAVIEQAVNRADLFRIKGIGTTYCKLLNAAGVNTLGELRDYCPDRLHARLADVTVAAVRLASNPPGEEMVKRWVYQAKELPPVVKI